MRLLRTLSPFCGAALLYAAVILIVNPRGDFPLNDDWSYTRSAFRFAATNHLHVDEWSAPSLIGQAFYGGLLVKIFGQNFVALRLSSLLLAALTTVSLWTTLRRLGTGKATACIASLAWMFNPIQFCLSYTFMTEIPFVFFISVAFLSFSIYLSRRTLGPLLATALILGYAFSIRQTALLFAAPLFFVAALQERPALKDRLRHVAAAAFCFAAFVAGYYFWVFHNGGSTPATRRKFTLLSSVTKEQLAGNSFGLLFYLSLLILPLAIYLIPYAYRAAARPARKTRAIILLLWSLPAVFGMWWFHSHYSNRPYHPSWAYHDQMPFLLNILYDTGLGPITLDPTYFQPPPFPTHRTIWGLLTIVLALGIVCIGTVITLSFRSTIVAKEFRRRLLPVAALLCTGIVAGFEVVFSHLQEGGLFDRHALSAAYPLFLVLASAAGSQQRTAMTEPREGKQRQATRPTRNTYMSRLTPVFAATVSAALCLLAFGYFSITATHDYLAWNRMRWQLGNELLTRGIDPLVIAGGFEFNGWNNYDTFRARGHVEGIYYWWYDRREYLITMGLQPGYAVQTQRDFRSWLHRRNVPMYVLRQLPSDQQDSNERESSRKQE